MLNTDEIYTAAKVLQNKSDELQQALQMADAAMNPMRQMASPRIIRNIEEWDMIKRALRNALEETDRAYQLLIRAANDNEAANR